MVFNLNSHSQKQVLQTSRLPNHFLVDSQKLVICSQPLPNREIYNIPVFNIEFNRIFIKENIGKENKHYQELNYTLANKFLETTLMINLKNKPIGFLTTV